MLRDARSLWLSATSAISSALETLDNQVIEDPADDNNEVTISEDGASFDPENDAQEEQHQLETYKALLEEAQMEHVKLSQVTRSIIASKDAEIRKLRAELSSPISEESSTASDNGTSNSRLLLLLEEKAVLESTIADLEAKYQSSLRLANDAKATQSKLEALTRQYNSLRRDYDRMKSDLDSLNKQKSETIEGLVEEYSKLSAECEIRSANDQKRIHQISQENEVLATKIHALEHSISEFADRESSPSAAAKNNSVEVVNLQAELKELKVKIVNLQYDLKERDERILRQKQQYIELQSSSSVSSEISSPIDSTAMSSLLAERENLAKDVERLIREKREAEEAGKSLLDQIRQLKRDRETKNDSSTVVDNLTRDLREKEAELAKLSAAHEAALSSMRVDDQRLMSTNAFLEDQLKVVREEVDRLLHERHSLSSEVSQVKELEEKNSSLHMDLEQARANAAVLNNQLQEASSLLKVKDDEITTLRQLLTAEELTRRRSEDEVLKSKEIIEQMTRSHQQELLLSNSTITEELESSYRIKIKELEARWTAEADSNLRKKEEELLKSFREELSQVESDAKEALQASVDKVKAEKASQLEAALKQAQIEAQAKFSASLQAARQEAQILTDEMKKKHDESIQQLLFELQQSKDHLTNVEQRYEVKMKEALAALEVRKDEERNEALNTLRKNMQRLVDEAVNEKEGYLSLYTKENKLRKSIHNKLLELQGNIRVICRVRPVLDIERKTGEDVDVTSFPSPEDIVIQRDPQTKSRFEFDRVFTPSSNQLEVFEAVQPLIVSVLDGYNVCIFAYGQTGSGKTFTMEGYGADYGISPRSISELFRLVDSLDEWSFQLQFSMLEIYNETILDLLDNNKDKDKLDIRQTSEGNVVSGLTEVVVSSPEQVKELMTQGQSNRAVGSHDMNERSSRSHSILTVACRGRNKLDGSVTYGKLHLIDLAGSERVSKTDATGDRLKEAQNINKSLSALGDVISALGNKKSTHVPYRNSKLTFLLQDSLGGNSKVLMFVNISPATYNMGESLCSLNFASRCRNVELGQATRKVSSGSEASTPSTSVKKVDSNGSLTSSTSSTLTPSKKPPIPSTSSKK